MALLWWRETKLLFYVILPFCHLSFQPAEESSGGEEKKAKRLCTEEGRANNGGITGTDASETTRESEQ